jgi:hypothetical protein
MDAGKSFPVAGKLMAVYEKQSARPTTIHNISIHPSGIQGPVPQP